MNSDISTDEGSDTLNTARQLRNGQLRNTPMLLTREQSWVEGLSFKLIEKGETMPQRESRVAALVAALREAWGMEHHSLVLLPSQLRALPDDRGIATALDRHLRETREQLRRLETIMTTLGETMQPTPEESASWACRFPLFGMDGRQSLLRQWWLTSISFENFEAAAYVALTALAKECHCDLAVSLLQKSLLEEYKMTADLDASIDELASSSVEIWAKVGDA